MVSTDPISDMLTRIRNAIAVHKTEVAMPHSKAKEAVVEILKQQKYITNFNVSEDGFRKTLTVELPEIQTINNISRVSKPGRRVYAKVSEIPQVKQGRGIVILSTSQGVMVGTEAKNKKLGGEILCQVY